MDLPGPRHPGGADGPLTRVSATSVAHDNAALRHGVRHGGGVCGIVAAFGEIDHDQCGRMLARVIHRGPDDTGELRLDLSLIHISEPTRPY